jgi:N-methylhydantoinase B
MTSDVIVQELIGNWLRSIAEEMGTILIQSSYSTTIKERRDCSTQLFDSKGRIICQGEHIPVHLGSSVNAARVILDEFQDIEEGDVFIVNDPYLGTASHLNDVCMLSPCFVNGELIGFASTVAHHTDLGGTVPGGASYASDSIHQEGLMIPPLRLSRHSTLCRDVYTLILRNTRDHQVREGDLNAQLGACAVGVKRLKELAERYGAETLLSSIDALLVDSDTKMRKGIEGIPNGTYEFTDYLDCSGIIGHDEPIPITVQVSIEGDTAAVDFSGTSLQVRSSVNLVRSGTLSAVWYAFRLVTGITAHPNEGCYQPIAVIAPPGTLVNCTYPAAVAQRTDTCQRVADVVLGALAIAVPDRVMAACHSTITSLIFGGTTQDGEFYVYNDVVAGGMGGRQGLDGIDGVQVHITNSSNLPIESLENEFPLMVTVYELITDTGGPGQHRGGMGIRRGIKAINGSRPIVTAATERHDTSPWGLLGGKEGMRGSVTIGDETKGRFYQRILDEETVLVETPGGGGYGDPFCRDIDAVRKDVLEERVSVHSALHDYGVRVIDGKTVDHDETERIRSRH